MFATWGSIGPTVVHVLRKWLASFVAGDVIIAALVIVRCSCYTLVSLCFLHYINGWCRIVVAVNGNAWTFSEQVISSRVLYMAVTVGWLTSYFALPHQLVGLPSCYNFWRMFVWTADGIQFVEFYLHLPPKLNYKVLQIYGAVSHAEKLQSKCFITDKVITTMVIGPLDDRTYCT